MYIFWQASAQGCISNHVIAFFSDTNYINYSLYSIKCSLCGLYILHVRTLVGMIYAVRVYIHVHVYIIYMYMYKCFVLIFLYRPLQRMVVGMFIAGLAFMVAGFVQIRVQNEDTSLNNGVAKVIYMYCMAGDVQRCIMYTKVQVYNTLYVYNTCHVM